MQLMHCGRIAHPENLPAGGEMLAPSAVPAKGQMWTDKGGMQDNGVPRAMNKGDIKKAIDEFVMSADLAVTAAGFGRTGFHVCCAIMDSCVTLSSAGWLEDLLCSQRNLHCLILSLCHMSRWSGAPRS